MKRSSEEPTANSERESPIVVKIKKKPRTLSPRRFISFLISFSFIFTFLYPSKEIRAESVTPDLPHRTDFLSLSACGGSCATTYFPTATASQRSAYISALKSKGYTHAYLSVVSGVSGHNYYGNAAGFNSLLTELNNNGIKAVVWLTSDTGTWRNKAVSEIKTDLTNFIPQVDSKVSSYVVGLEANEYWTSSEIQDIGSHMDSLTSKPLAAHQTPGKWDYCSQSWCDYMILQTNNPSTSVTTSFVKQKVIDARNSLGKPVVAGEYSDGPESTSISLGNAGLEGCAAGFGNGGTPSKIIWPNGAGCGTSNNTPTPTSSVNQAPVADSATYSVNPGGSVLVIFSWDDPDGPGPYTYTITQNPTKGSLSGSSTDNDWTYTANSGASGVDTFKWRVNDGIVNSNIATVTINIGSAKPGDANGDGNVDGLDYVVWLTNYNKSVSGGASQGDFDNSGKVDGLDYVVWLTNYGK